MGLVLALIAIAIALVVAGVIIDGLAKLLILGVIVLILALVYGTLRGRRRPPR